MWSRERNRDVVVYHTLEWWHAAHSVEGPLQTSELGGEWRARLLTSWMTYRWRLPRGRAVACPLAMLRRHLERVDLGQTGWLLAAKITEKTRHSAVYHPLEWWRTWAS